MIRLIRGKVLFVLDGVCSALSDSTRVATLSVTIEHMVGASVATSATPIPARRRESIPFWLWIRYLDC